MKIFLIYLLLMNIAGFAAMGIDKCKAKAHAWRIPEKTLFGLSLLGGTAIVESIFMWDGVGKLAVDAIQMRDYPLIQAYVVWMAIIYVVVNLITDLLYRVLDPKIRLGAEKE